MGNINFIDLKKQYHLYEVNIREAIEEVLAGGQYIMGSQVKELEDTLAKFVGVKHSIGVSSGTDALLLPLMAWGIGPGDGVITSPFTFIATAEVISFLGATPIFVDIDTVTYNISPEQLRETLLSENWPAGIKPKVVIPVSLYGQVADMHEITIIAEEFGLKVLEDGCQSFGAEYRGKKSCSFKDAGVTSFFPSKPLGCYGDGGMIFTDDDGLTEACRAIRVHGQQKRYIHDRIGVNARLDTLQAAILLAKWPFFLGEIEKRREVAERYTSNLKDTVVTPVVKDDRLSVFAQYTVRMPVSLGKEGRGKVVAYLKEKGIPTAVHYPVPLHLQTAFKGLQYHVGDFPQSELAASQVMSLPMHPWLNKSTQDFIIKSLKEAVKKCDV